MVRSTILQLKIPDAGAMKESGFQLKQFRFLYLILVSLTIFEKT